MAIGLWPSALILQFFNTAWVCRQRRWGWHYSNAIEHEALLILQSSGSLNPTGYCNPHNGLFSCQFIPFVLLSWFCLVAVLLNYSWKFESLFAVMHSTYRSLAPLPKSSSILPLHIPTGQRGAGLESLYLTGATLLELWVEFLPSEKRQCVFSATNTKTLLTHNLLSGLLLLNWFLPNWFLTSF